MSTILTAQNPYAASKYGITIRRQQQYLFAFQSPIDKNPVLSLGRQIRPSYPQWLKCVTLKLMSNVRGT